MKKTIILFLLSVLFVHMLTVSEVSASTVSAHVSLDQSSRQVTISGSISTGADQLVTVFIQSPDGAIDYLDQTTSGTNGDFEFSYILEEEKTGTYQVKVGGTGVDPVSVASFEYTGETKSSDSSDSGKSNVRGTMTDINSHWAKEEIRLLVSKYIIQEGEDTTFVPERSLTRAEFVTWMVRSLGIQEVESSGTFDDVDQGAWYAGALEAAAEAELVLGYPDGTFHPLDPITREQIAVMFERALEYTGHGAVKNVDPDDVLATYMDGGKISSWAIPGAAASVEAGIIQGVTEDTFAPDKQATFAEAAVMISRMLKYVEAIN